MTDQSASAPKRRFRFRQASRTEEFWLFMLLIALFGTFTIINGPRFLSFPVIRSMAVQMPELGLLALAMMITLLSGGINLAVISSAVLGGIVSALIFTQLLPTEMASDPGVAVLVLASLVGIAASTLTGLTIGILVARFRVSPILATLGIMTTVNGVNLLLTGGRSISGMPVSFRALAEGSVLGIPAPLILFSVCAIWVSLLLTRTAFGKNIYMIGSNEPAARYAGVDTQSVIIRLYVVSGVLSGVAGILMLARFNSINSGFGDSYLLVTILAAVLGGVNPFGGFGTVRGLVLGLLILQVLSSGLNMLHLSSHVTLALSGGLLVAVMGVRVILGRSAI